MAEGWRRLFDVPERLLGFRGTALLLFALVYAGIAISIPYAPQPAQPLYDGMLPVWFRIGLWATCASIAIVAIFVQKPRWQGRGFGALLLPAGERFTSYGLALVLNDETLRWLPGTLIYALVCAILLLVAAWPEPVLAPPSKKVR